MLGDFKIDPIGNPILDKDASGKYINRNGKIMNQKGYIIDKHGKLINKRTGMLGA